MARSNQRASENISFRITPDLLAVLTEYANAQLSETGRQMTVGQAARKLVFNELREMQKKKEQSRVPKSEDM
ncbi:MAG: hypothetical protein P4M08_02505 [Oligoflexia bacterium]|nr:hypothetical protein [Oligoflexia bacterium]